MTIVVGGYIVGYPLGGMTWHHLNYLLGLRDLGHEVIFLEDADQYTLPYDPATQRCGADSAYGREYLRRALERFDLPIQYCYCSHAEDRCYGLSERALADVLKRADLLLCLSGVTPLRESRPRPRRTAVIDTDPVYTQFRMTWDPGFKSYYQSFDRAFTFGKLIGSPQFPLATHDIDWVPTNQPVSLRHWPASPCDSRRFTTIGKWEHAITRAVDWQGGKLLSSKAPEWEKVIDLPRRCGLELSMGMQSMPADAIERFAARGWRMLDPEIASRTCEGFQEFVRASAGEFTVVKQIYSGIPSGWFSDRSACYLATARPVVTQSTGFEQWLPAGEGLFAFDSIDSASDAIARIDSDYARHATAARRIAEQYFDSRRVLAALIDAAM